MIEEWECGFFEKTMDMFRDLYKLVYLRTKGREVPKRFKRKPYYLQLSPPLENLVSLLKKVGR